MCTYTVKSRGRKRDLHLRQKKKNMLYVFSCREKKDAEISGLEQERNRELEELQQLEDENNRIRERVTSMARQYNRSEST